MRILLAGTPKTTVLVAEALVTAQHEIVGVICPFPKPVGRKQIVTPSAIEIWAITKNIPVHHVDRTILQTKSLTLPPKVDLLVVTDFGFLIPGWLLTYPKHGSLNIHPSLLPRWRGATPIPYTILFGDTLAGVTIIKMNEKFDMGEIVAQVPVEINPDDTTPTLLHRTFQAGAHLLVEVLPAYVHGNLHLKPQPLDTPVPTSRKFTKDDGFVPYETLQKLANNETVTSTHTPLLKEYGLPETIQTLDQMIRALTPWPCAWTILPDGKRMKLMKSHIEDNTLVFDEIRKEGEPRVFHKRLQEFPSYVLECSRVI